MNNIRESKDRAERNNNIIWNLIKIFSGFMNSLFDSFRNTIEISYFSVDYILLALSHNRRTKDFESTTFNRTNKNLDFRSSYIECDKLMIIDNITYLE